MTLPLLATKLHLPHGRPGIVPRPRLLARLEEGLAVKVSLVCAPAGFGKTTLLAEWLRQVELAIAWITLDADDNDLARFLSYLLAALQSLGLPGDPGLSDLLTGTQLPEAQAVLIPLLNQFEEYPGRAVLALDDYHLVTNPAVHAALAYLIDHQPPNLHLAIATRADPPLPLARLRARGELSEVRAADLRFSLAEGRELLTQVQRLEITNEDLQALVTRTEGWIAGLQLAALAMQGRADLPGFIHGFSGGHDYIADYLAGEVLQGQPAHIQEFLLRTSILERLSGPLCAQVSGQPDSEAILAALKNANLFLVPLDEESRWYRYHHLFQDLLQRRLYASQPELVPELYRRASVWFTGQSALPEAIDYALAGEDYLAAITLIERAAVPTLQRSEIATFRRWVAALPEGTLLEAPRLAILAAWALLIDGGAVEAAAAQLEQVAGLPLSAPARAQAEAVGAMLAAHQKNFPHSIDLARRALEGLPASDHFFRQLAAWSLSAALYITGQQAEGEAILAELARLGQASGNTLVAVIALCRQATAQLHRGELHRPQALFQRALELAETANGDRHLVAYRPVASEALIGLGKIHWERFELEAAEDNLQTGQVLSRSWRPQTSLEAALALAELYQAQGKAQQAGEMIARAQALAAQTAATALDDRYVLAVQATVWIARGTLAPAWEWARQAGLEPYGQGQALPAPRSPGSDLVLRYELMIFARLLLAAGRWQDARLLLERLQPAMDSAGIFGKRIEIHVLLAEAWLGLAQPDHARASLHQALQLAAPEGHARHFFQASPAVLNLLADLVNAADPEVKTLFGERIPAPVTAGTSGLRLVEPLTDRELEVLALLATDLTVPEIAARLYIADSTARSHIKNIYAKLDVHNRYAALERARSSGLL